jgi:hypothetical protein
MDQSRINRSAGQESSRILWIPKAQFRVYKTRIMVTVFSHTVAFKSTLIVSFHLCLGFIIGFFHSSLLAKTFIRISHLSHPCYMIHASYHVNLINLVMSGDKYKLSSSLLFRFLHPPVISSSWVQIFWFLYLSICLSIYLSIYLIYLSIYLSNLSVCLSGCLPTHPPTALQPFCWTLAAFSVS